MALFGKNYDSVVVGEYQALPSGGYVCRIRKAQMTNNSNGLPMVEVMIDIAEGEFDKLYHEYSAKYKIVKKEA